MGISLVARLLPIQDNINTEDKQADIRAFTGIQTHDPSVRAGEHISWPSTARNSANVTVIDRN
jgi:hypothetical protein